MIKILRPGTRKEAECPSCGALLSYDISDLLEIVALNCRNIICILAKQ